MNKNLTLQLVQERFGNYTEIAPDLFRAEYRLNAHPISVIYYDFSQSVLHPDFNLQSFTLNHIASDFYKHDSSLQWNYYLYFVLDNNGFRKFHTNPRAAAIEADRTFARKFIRDQASLEIELKKPLASIIHQTAPSQDIASQWIEELTDAGLELIADASIGYDPLVTQILLGELAPRRTLPTTTNQQVDKGYAIQTLSWDDQRFRLYPRQKSFDFGLVNLIHGANGTGKTSLLEAVELSICGGIRRQGGKCPPGAQIYVQFMGQSKIEPSLNQNQAMYRARDLAWYGSHYRHKNNLCHSFGRFNFFDSDAAVQLSEASAPAKIVEAIDALLLGDLAAVIEERMSEFQTRFKREERRLDIQAKNLRLKIKETASEISKLESITDTRQALLSELHAKLENSAWKKIPARLKLNDLALLLETAEEISNWIEQISERLSWLGQLSIASIMRELDNTQLALKELSEKRKLATSTITALDKYNSRYNELTAEIKTISRLHEYHRSGDAMTLIGLNAKITRQEQRVTQLKEAHRILEGSDMSRFREITFTLGDFSAQNNSDYAKRHQSIAKLKERESSILSHLDNIRAVVQQIRGFGKRYCELSPSSDDCPLCGTHHDDLAIRIRNLEYNAPLELALQELSAQLSHEESLLQETLRTTAHLNQIKLAVGLILEQEAIESHSLQRLVQVLSSLEELIDREQNKLNELHARQIGFELTGFDEAELKELLQSAQEALAIPRSKLMAKEALEDIEGEKIQDLDILRHNIREKEKLQKSIDADIRRILKHFFSEPVLAKDFLELERRESLAKEALKDLAQIQKTISIPDATELSSVKHRVDLLAKAIERIQKALKAVEEKDAVMPERAAILAGAKAELYTIDSQHKRAQGVLTILARLLGEGYKNVYLAKVSQEHRERISGIFSQIHSPHEFRGVLLGTEQMLLERDTGSNCTVSEISTGQRAALALSIFLSLNSSVNENAPWMLFDDPIVYVDDLNTLSFFDTLRELVLLGNRQVFFATASTKIADLFRRKFDFLGNDYKEFSLQR